MRRSIVLLLALLLGMTLLAGCGGGKTADGGKEATIVGTWKAEIGGIEITYKEDGTFENWGVTKKYTFENGILTHIGDNFNSVFEVKFEGGKTMILTQTDPFPLAPAKYTRK